MLCVYQRAGRRVHNHFLFSLHATRRVATFSCALLSAIGPIIPILPSVSPTPFLRLEQSYLARCRLLLPWGSVWDSGIRDTLSRRCGSSRGLLTKHVCMYSLCRVFPLLRCFIVTLSETRRYEHHWHCHGGSSNEFKSKQIPARVLRAPAPPFYHLCMVAELGFLPRIPK